MTTTANLKRRRIRAVRLGNWSERIGWVLLGLLVFIAIFGSTIATHSADAPVGIPGAAPYPGYPLGLDFLGRDVLSRVLSGGGTVLWMGASAAVLTYVVGTTAGMLTGYVGGWLDSLLMRSIDVILSFPALLVMLLAVTALGGTPIVLVVAASLVLFPGVTRLVRTVTLDVSRRGYVDAAVARGESVPSILFREILPNLATPLIADVGVRYSWAIVMIAGVNYLGLGLQPPASDWGLMISENRASLATNPWGEVAPAVMLGILIISVNLIGDGYMSRLATGRRKGKR
jgi:ABC-type dipeptide/oligopeptide/nickel transport system permease subunit